jgi:hypothetical protein
MDTLEEVHRGKVKDSTYYQGPVSEIGLGPSNIMQEQPNQKYKMD